MRVCDFPGCERIPHSSSIPHAAWDRLTGSWATLTEQRTRAQIARDNQAAALREKAERIAADILDDDGSDAAASIREMLIAAALAGMEAAS